MASEDEYRWSLRAPKRRLAALLSTLLVAAPFLLFLRLLPRFGELPRDDDRSVFGGVLTPAGELVREPRAWLTARSNGHPVGLQLPLRLLNLELTGGDNRGLATLSLACLVLLFALLYRRLPYPVRAGPGSRTAYALPLAVLVATPLAARGWFVGSDGIRWFLTNLLVVTGLALLCAEGRSRARSVLAVALLCGLATLGHGSSLGLGPALVAGAILLPFGGFARTVLVGLAAGISTLDVLLVLSSGETPTPAASPRRIAASVLESLGSSWSEAADVARLAGAAGLFALAGGLWIVWPRRREPAFEKLVFWALVGIYPVGTAVGSAVEESGLGDGDASKPALFWIGLLALLSLLARELAAAWRRRAALAALATAAAGLLLSTWTIGERRLRHELERLEPSPLSALGPSREVWDPETRASAIDRPAPRSGAEGSAP